MVKVCFILQLIYSDGRSMEKDQVNQRKQKTYYTMPALKEEDTHTTDPANISEILVSTFQQTSINNNHLKEFQMYKLETKAKPP